MRKSNTLLHEMLCGLLLGLLIMPAQPVRAQFLGGIVFDPKAYALKIEEKIENANRFLQTVRHYQETFTSLRGILATVERNLAKDMEVAHLTVDIGTVIHGAYMLQNQVRNMVKYEIASLQQIDDRLRNGIFDPDKDLADLEEYLIYSMGRSSRQTIQRAVRTALADAQVSKWVTDRRLLQISLAEAYYKLNAYRKRLEREKNNTDPMVIKSLNEAIQQIEMQIIDLKKSIAELSDKIEERIKAHGLRLSDMENFGYSIESTSMAWEGLLNSKSQIADTFDAAFLNMQPEQ